jgi:hypothetical protein
MISEVISPHAPQIVPKKLGVGALRQGRVSLVLGDVIDMGESAWQF